MFIKLWATALLACLSLMASISASFHPQQDKCHYQPLEFENHAAFKKIYVDYRSILCQPQGIYYKHACGKLEKAYSLSHDCQGMYILCLYSQCSHCGRVYEGAEAPEGWSCLQGS